MKKILFVTAITLISFGLKAQKGYVDVNFGYGFGAPGTVLGQNTHAYRFMYQEKSRTVENINGSLGKGFNIQLTGGYMFNKHIGLELGIGFFGGSNTLISQTQIALKDTTWNIDADNFSSSKTFARVNQLRLSPAVVFSTDTIKGISGYAKLGLIIPVYGSATTATNSINSQVNYSDGSITRDRVSEKYVISGKVALGFRGAVGLQYAITPKIAVFGEVYASSVTVKHSDRKMKQYTVNGEDKMASKLAYQKDIQFVDKIDDQSNNPTSNQTGFDPNSPYHELYQKTTLSQIGIQIGFKYMF